MSFRTFNLDNVTYPNQCFAIEQGATFDWFTLYIKDEDFTSWLPTGQIRNNYAANLSTYTLDFNFDPLLFGWITLENESFEATIIRPTLTYTQTLTLPLLRTRTATDRVRLGSNALAYDLKLTSPQGKVIIISRGLVEVLPDVTRL